MDLELTVSSNIIFYLGLDVTSKFFVLHLVIYLLCSCFTCWLFDLLLLLW